MRDPQNTPDAGDDERRVTVSGLNPDILIEGLKIRRQLVEQARRRYRAQLALRDKDILDAVRAYVSYRQIAKALDVSIATIANVVRKNP